MENRIVKLTWKDGTVDFFRCKEEIGAAAWAYDAIEGIDYELEEMTEKEFYAYLFTHSFKIEKEK